MYPQPKNLDPINQDTWAWSYLGRLGWMMVWVCASPNKQVGCANVGRAPGLGAISRKQSPKLSRKGTIAPLHGGTTPSTLRPTLVLFADELSGRHLSPARHTVTTQVLELPAAVDGGDQIWVWFRLWGDDDVSEARFG
ncbi:hypothetical protein V6N12_020005 [Hibiscus sabdariffa]|uniref:Uncharacterized protein n=1 Tax=Hibiscus sabdariffa TaxID=183260 RepID=A0ABR2B699_9ROSI